MSKILGLDTNVLIYYLDQHPVFGEAALTLIKKLKSGKAKGVTSVITLIELLSNFYLSEKDVEFIKDKYLEIPNLETIEVSRDLSIEAARIRREYGFRLPDAIQLATAISAKAKAFISNDKNLKKFKELEVILLS